MVVEVNFQASKSQKRDIRDFSETKSVFNDSLHGEKRINRISCMERRESKEDQEKFLKGIVGNNI